ncbi:hypothetical protein CL620_02215 [archaeon]|nr:hypothetical protein [archaeon]
MLLVLFFSHLSQFKTDVSLIEQWVKILETHELITIHYPAFGSARLALREKEEGTVSTPKPAKNVSSRSKTSTTKKGTTKTSAKMPTSSPTRSPTRSPTKKISPNVAPRKVVLKKMGSNITFKKAPPKIMNATPKKMVSQKTRKQQ